jgi:hypothetical protein
MKYRRVPGGVLTILGELKMAVVLIRIAFAIAAVVLALTVVNTIFRRGCL